VEHGSIIGLLGPNGSGKSTLIRGLLGLAPIQRGSLQLFGVDRRQFRDWQRLGYVPQRQTVTGGIPSTVTEVVASGRLTKVRPFRFGRSADRVAVREAIRAVGLTALSRHPMAKLSGGQQRRVLIARALASEPELLVLDEPTAGVDQANQEALTATLSLLSKRGTTIVLITHELGSAAPLVTRTLVMHDGRITYDGSAPGAPDEHHEHDRHLEHDDEWHHPHGAPPRRGPDLGLTG
jgi:zinc transport system ATP-binding protein